MRRTSCKLSLRGVRNLVLYRPAPPDPRGRNGCALIAARKNFSEQINRLSENDSDNNRWLQGIIPDLIINTLHLEHLEKLSTRTLWRRHYPRGCQDASTRADLLRVGIHSLRPIRPEARRQGTQRQPQYCQEARHKSRHARGRN